MERNSEEINGQTNDVSELESNEHGRKTPSKYNEHSPLFFFLF
jgi:hypothetical protein